MAHHYVDFDATIEGMELLAAFTAALRSNGQAFKAEPCGGIIRVTLT